MTKAQICPFSLSLLDLAAAVAYGVVDGDIRKVIYWLSAAVLSITVTF